MILKYFLLLIVRPRRAIEEIMRAEIKLRRMLVFLLSLGILRAILETVWLFALSHKLPLLLCLSSSASWWLLEGGPFLLANILTAYLGGRCIVWFFISP
ncbi:MAG: hypothetical protein HZC16_02270 [Candidatus Omnitrophica bacterium]|nr:hypothetical protein [Candidatus Omnitrophota bacterium]